MPTAASHPFAPRYAGKLSNGQPKSTWSRQGVGGTHHPDRWTIYVFLRVIARRDNNAGVAVGPCDHRKFLSVSRAGRPSPCHGPAAAACRSNSTGHQCSVVVATVRRGGGQRHRAIYFGGRSDSHRAHWRLWSVSALASAMVCRAGVERDAPAAGIGLAQSLRGAAPAARRRAPSSGRGLHRPAQQRPRRVRLHA